jgi:hypothetical protein
MPMSLELIRAELECRDLPKRYVKRVCGELAAHLDDLAEDLVAEGHPQSLAQSMANTRIGCPVELANRLCRLRAEQSFWLRHRLLMVFVTSVSVFLALAAAQLAVFASIWRALSPAALGQAQLLARIGLAVLGSWILHSVLALYVHKQRWSFLAAVILIVLSVTSVVRLVPVSQDHAVATLRLIP